jgi:hypothetical protein
MLTEQKNWIDSDNHATNVNVGTGLMERTTNFQACTSRESCSASVAGVVPSNSFNARSSVLGGRAFFFSLAGEVTP